MTTPKRRYAFRGETVSLPVELKEGVTSAMCALYVHGDPEPVGEIEVTPEQPFEFEVPLREPPEHSPLRIVLSEDLQAPTGGPARCFDVAARFAVDFGKDKLTVTASTEGGPAAGEGMEGGSGQSASGSANVKLFFGAPLFPVSMFYSAGVETDDVSTDDESSSKDPTAATSGAADAAGSAEKPGETEKAEEKPGEGGKDFSERLKDEVVELATDRVSIGIFLRFVLRFFYHSVDAMRLAIDFMERHADADVGGAVDEEEAAGGTGEVLGLGWWTSVFTLFAIKDTLADLALDHPRWVKRLLDELEFQLQADVVAAVAGTAYVNLDLNETVSAKLRVPLATLLLPVIDVLTGAAQEATGAEGDAPTLADMITPYIRAVVEDRVCMKVGAFPVAFEVESRGTVARGTLGLPHGSPLRERLNAMGREMEKMAVEYKQGKLEELPPESRYRGLTTLKMILDLLDKEVRALVIDQDLAAAWDALSPHANPVFGKIMGEAVGAMEESALGQQALQLVHLLAAVTTEAGARIVCEPALPGQCLGVEEAADGRARLWVLLQDAEKTALLAAGFAPPAAPEEAWEAVTFSVPLPVAPKVVAWNSYEDPGAGAATSGIVAGFETAAEAAAFAAAPLQPGLPGAVWDPAGGLHFAWVETTLLEALAARDLPPPALSCEGKALRLRFGRAPVGEVTAALLGLPVTGTARQPVWRVVLLEAAAPVERWTLEQVLQQNQAMTPDVTPTWEDDSWVDLPPAPAADPAPGLESRPRWTPLHRDRRPARSRGRRPDAPSSGRVGAEGGRVAPHVASLEALLGKTAAGATKGGGDRTPAPQVRQPAAFDRERAPSPPPGGVTGKGGLGPEDLAPPGDAPPGGKTPR